MNDAESGLSKQIIALKTRVSELEDALAQSKKQESLKSALCSELVLKYNKLAAQASTEVNGLQARITELETGQGSYNQRLSWLGKVTFVLRRVGRPLRASELFTEINKIDPELRKRADPAVYLSVVLSNGVKAGRLVKHKLPGTRGAFYALEEWIDESGELDIDMQSELL